MTEAADTPTSTTCPIETFTAIWQGITLEITYGRPHWLNVRDLVGYDIAHLTVCSVAPVRASLPITETGYRSSYPSVETVADYGGAVAFVLAWLDQEACSPAGRNQQAADMQLTLF